MGRRIWCRIALVLLLSGSVGKVALAQEKSFADNLEYAVGLTGAAKTFGSDHAFASLDMRFGYALTPWLSLFVPASVSELMYNRSTSRNYDLSVQTGLGARLGHEFRSKDGIGVSLSGMTTLGKGGDNWWHVRVMGEYVMPGQTWRMFVGLGVEYLKPYGTSSVFGGVYPVVSIGLRL